MKVAVCFVFVGCILAPSALGAVIPTLNCVPRDEWALIYRDTIPEDPFLRGDSVSYNVVLGTHPSEV